jgi:hypothetical protein
VVQPTPFYPKRDLLLSNAYSRLERELFGPWSLFNSGKSITVTPCEGKPQTLGGGIEFSGSAREIFWRFFDPDIRKIITDQIQQTVADCESLPHLLEQALNETRELLRALIQKSYERLATIDQRLRGKGFPNSVIPRTITDKLQMMFTFLDEHIEAEKRLAVEKRWGNILLEPKQKHLLIDLVEASRNVPEDIHFEIRVVQDRSNYYLEHPGFTAGSVRVVFNDLRLLAEHDLIDVSSSSTAGISLVSVKPRGNGYYTQLKREVSEPIERVESTIRQYLDSTRFRNSYPQAYRKWIEAETLLWEVDSQEFLTTIGHYCREAMQEFTDVLLQRHNLSNAEPDKSKTVARLQVIISANANKFGEKGVAFLKALVAYWGTVADLTQRQEHGGQKDGQPLILEDARRVVFQTLLVMYEVDRAIPNK